MNSPSGEERLLTLYADVHYYFGEPTPRPTHHRFDKESYVYLYRDPRSGRGRIEIANHAGTSEQDAFTGFLDNVSIHQTFRHPNLCIMTVNGAGKSAQPDNHWRLPSTDPRDEGNYLFRLHTIDLYFWTEADSAQFVHAIASTLRQEQLQVDTLPLPSPREHEQPMSPVVQNLENMAISHDGGSQKARSSKTLSPQPASHHSDRSQQSRSSLSAGDAGAAAAGVAAGVAAGAAANAAGAAASASSPHHDKNYTPLAYNPAAPAAPEKHAHRERTPPPPEGAEGTGLAAAAARDAGRMPPPGLSSNASFGPTATPSFGPGAPSTINPSNLHSPIGSPNVQSPLGSPYNHSPGGQQNHLNLSQHSLSQNSLSQTSLNQSNPHLNQNYTPNASSYSTHPPSSASTAHPMSPSSRTSQSGPTYPGPPSRSNTDHSIGNISMTEQTPTNEILGPNFRHTGVPLQHLQPQYPDYLAQRVSQNAPPPVQSQGYHAVGQKPANKHHELPENVRIGGYGNYNYAAPPPQSAAGGYHDGNPYQTGDYAVHSQVYRPTEEEAHSHGKKGSSSSGKYKLEGDAKPGRLEQGAERVEKKVNRFLRGIEKKLG